MSFESKNFVLLELKQGNGNQLPYLIFSLVNDKIKDKLPLVQKSERLL